MSGLIQFAGRAVRDALRKHGIEDETLAQELVDVAFKVRAFQPETRAANIHPALALCRELTRRDVPDILRAEIIALWDETPDAALWRAAWADWRRAGRPAEAWTWTKWPRTKTKPRYVGANGRTQIDPFATLTVGD